MDNKLFDHIEQQMKTAANSWEPAFDEKAWEDMERKLDREKDRKKPVAWWSWLLPLLFLLITGGYFLWGKNINNKQGDSPIDKITSGSPATILKNFTSENEKESSDKIADPLPVQKSGNPVSFPVYKKLSRPIAIFPERSTVIEEEKFSKNEIAITEKGKMTIKISAGQAGEEDNDEIIKEGNTGIDKRNKEIIQAHKEDSADLITGGEKQSTVTSEKTTDTVGKTTARTENKKERKSSKFYFSVAAGIEGNGVDFPGINKFTARAGFMVGYQLTKKLSVQTGFFAGNKKYVAGRGDYKAKGGYWATVDITKVEADCRVYEIPLALRYDFNPSAKWNSFAVAGLSSYIMDQEDYGYNYIRSGNPYYAEATYKGNQHFLSVLRLSGGIERKISPQFSLGINPGLAIPLAGVGEGQIRLFSTELSLSLKYRPFKRSR